MSNQEEAERAIWPLLGANVAVRGVSYEPALGPVDFTLFDLPRIHWIIAGGESGPGFRPCEVAWFEAVRQQCAAAGVAFWMKQDCGPRDGLRGRIPADLWAVRQFPEEARG